MIAFISNPYGASFTVGVLLAVVVIIFANRDGTTTVHPHHCPSCGAMNDRN